MARIGYYPITPLPVGQAVATPTEAFFQQFTTQTRYELNGPALSIAAHPAASELAIATSTQVLLYQASSGTLTKGTGRFTMITTSVAYRHDGALYVGADDAGAVEVFIPGSHSWQRRFYDSTAAVHAVSFSTSGFEVLAGTRSGKLFVWTVTSESLCFGVQAHNDSIRSIIPLPLLQSSENNNGNSFAPVLTASYDRYIRIWNTATGEIGKGISEDPKRLNAKGKPGSGQSLLFEYVLPDPVDAALYFNGYVYVASGGTIYSLLYINNISAPDRERSIVSLKPHAQSDYVPKGVSSLCICPTSMGSFLVAGCFDGGIRVFDTSTLLQVATIAHLDTAVLSVAVQSFAKEPSYTRSEAIGIYVGIQAKTLVLITSCSIQEAIAAANQPDSTKRTITRKDFIVQPRQNLDYTVHKLDVRPSLSQIDIYLSICKHLDALQLGLVTSKELTGSILLELECRGVKGYHEVLKQLRDGDKVKILEYTMKSLGNNMLCGPFLRACEVIIKSITLSSSGKLLLTVHEFLLAIEKEMELIDRLQTCRSALCAL